MDDIAATNQVSVQPIAQVSVQPPISSSYLLSCVSSQELAAVPVSENSIRHARTPQPREIFLTP